MKTLEDPRIVERLGAEKEHRNDGCWKSGYVHLYDSVRAYEDLAAVLGEQDANTLIFVMQDLAPPIMELFSLPQRKDLKSRLERHLDDERICKITSDCSQADEDDTTTVKAAAEYALKELGKYFGK